jgi:hypothetical protein
MKTGKFQKRTYKPFKYDLGIFWIWVLLFPVFTSYPRKGKTLIGEELTSSFSIDED